MVLLTATFFYFFYFSMLLHIFGCLTLLNFIFNTHRDTHIPVHNSTNGAASRGLRPRRLYPEPYAAKSGSRLSHPASPQTQAVGLRPAKNLFQPTSPARSAGQFCKKPIALETTHGLPNALGTA